MILIVYLNHVFYVKNGISSEILLQKMVLWAFIDEIWENCIAVRSLSLTTLSLIETS